MKKLLQSLLIMLFLGTAFNTTAQIRITGVDPAQNLIFIRNYGTTTVDVTGHMLCSKFNYFSVGSLTVIAGNPSALGSMQTAWVQGNSLDANGADLGLFLPGTSGGVGVASNMLDFVQWKTGGNGRESVAVIKEFGQQLLLFVEIQLIPILVMEAQLKLVKFLEWSKLHNFY